MTVQSASNLRIVPKNDHDDAVLSTSAPAATNYPIENTQNCIRHKVWRSTDTTTQSILGLLPETRHGDFFGLFLHTVQHSSLRLQLYSDPAWTAQVYDSGTISADWYTSGSATWSDGSADPFIEEAPFRLWFPLTAYRSYKVTFSAGSPTIAAYWQVGRLWIGKYVEFAYDPAFGQTLAYSDLTERNRSRGGSLRSNVGPIWRLMVMDLNRVLESERAQLIDIFRYVGTGRDVVVSLFPQDNTRLERDHMMNAKMLALDPIGRQESTLTQKLQFEEV